jgi:hypothetical protein
VNGLSTRTKGLLVGLCPSEVFLLLVLLLSGTIAIFHYDRPDPISLLLPRWVSVGWDITLITGSIITLGGLVTLHWAVVRLGYTLLFPAAAAYAVALAPHASTLPIRINVILLLAFSFAGLWRCLQITFTIRGSG